MKKLKNNEIKIIDKFNLIPIGLLIVCGSIFLIQIRSYLDYSVWALIGGTIILAFGIGTLDVKITNEDANHVMRKNIPKQKMG